MEKFFKRKAPSTPDSGSSGPSLPKEIDLSDLPWDPSERKRILDYHPNQRDEIRRKYLIRGPCQPRGHDFPRRMIGNSPRHFIESWFDKYRNWLEYSVKADRAYCLFCYLFRDQFGRQGGSDAFVVEGFNSWNKTERFSSHVGEVSSFHNKALEKCEALIKQDQSIHVAFHKQSDLVKNEYQIRLNSSIDACRFLLKCSLPFRGHDESEKSIFKGNFLETIQLIREQNESIRKVTLTNAPGNNQMVAPSIQRDICNCFAQEVINFILDEIGDDVFALLVDESSDVSKKEQMAVILRFVDKYGIVKERFVGLIHVKDTYALSLKSAIDSLFAEYNLSLMKIRGQGYDGASNMSGEFKGLKALILSENPSAYYVHCFAHQLQLVVVTIVNEHLGAGNFFDMISTLMNVVCASCKRKDRIRESQKQKLEEAIGNDEIKTGRGLNQELSLIRAGDTRWSSHYKRLLRLVDLFPSVLEVLKCVENEADKRASKTQASGLQAYLKSFEFVLYLHLMLNILGVTDLLSQALQRKDQDILNAMSLLESTKYRLKMFRTSEWFDSLLVKISSFCNKYNIQVLDMKEDYVNPKSQRQKTGFTNRQYFEGLCCNQVLDLLNNEFDDRFNEVSSELLICIASLNPRDSFSDFDKSKILRMAAMYPNDFSNGEMMSFELELDLYIHNVQKDERFGNLTGLVELAKVMVTTRKNYTFPLVYRLLKLALVLPVATASVERCFSAMKHVKSDLRNRMGGEFLNACVICAVEKEAFLNVTNEDIINRFQRMKTRREQL